MRISEPSRRAAGEDEHPEKKGDNPQIDPPRDPGEPPVRKDPPPPEPPQVLLRPDRDESRRPRPVSGA